jgi:hypothetical protein
LGPTEHTKKEQTQALVSRFTDKKAPDEWQATCCTPIAAHGTKVQLPQAAERLSIGTNQRGVRFYLWRENVEVSDPD